MHNNNKSHGKNQSKNQNQSIDRDTVRCFDSGLYAITFYTTQRIDMTHSSFDNEDVEFNRELLAQHYQDNWDFVYERQDDEWEQVENEFWERLSYHCFYSKPLLYNEKIALECSLTPFKYQDEPLLALSSGGMDLTPRLDSYQALTHGTIDESSKLFSDRGYFEQVMGEEITQRVIAAISPSSKGV